jgi:uncharacterized membrane protein
MNTYPPFDRGRGFGYGPMVDHFHNGNGTLAWATFALVLLLVLTFGAYLIATFAARGAAPRHGMHFRGRRPDALEVLRMRFASGQMTREEFLQASGDLTSTTVEQPPPATA